MKSIAAQIEGMRRLWPREFDLIGSDHDSALWEGVLTPDQRSYRLRVFVRAPLAIENVTAAMVQPRVQVLEPKLTVHPKYDLPIPHVYRNKDDKSLPFLCLFDPAGREWTTDDLVAETTIPWTSTYLLFYEAWLLTGKWFAKERHPVDNEYGTIEKRSSPVRGHADGPSPAALVAGR